ncbi:hypothetical protein FQA39_LY06927 [Lamprigera yunnana]|nr:hypothetical protein FQA39_LY06927 [Lamprigera yunnana]
MKQDHVFTQLSTCQQSEDLFAVEKRYHEYCNRDNLRLSRNSETPAGRPNKILEEILHNEFDKLIDEIKDKFLSHSFEVSFLASRLAKLTNIDDAVIENRVVKSLLIDKYYGNIVFSYPADRSKSSFVFMGNISTRLFPEYRVTIAEGKSQIIAKERQINAISLLRRSQLKQNVEMELDTNCSRKKRRTQFIFLHLIERYGANILG